MISKAFLQARITKTEELIVLYEDAIAALAGAGAIQQYRLDTGQSITTVTRADLDHLQSMLDSLYNRLDVLNAKCFGGVLHVRGAW